MKMTLKATMLMITSKCTTFWMLNSLHLPEQNEKTKPTVNFRQSQTDLMYIFLSVITYSKLLPNALHIVLVYQTSPGLLRTENPLPAFTVYYCS